MRINLSPSHRFAIFKRDNFTCRYCGRNRKDGVKLQVDHIHSVSAGGDNRTSNLVTACWECNIGKGKKPMEPSQVPQSPDEAEKTKAREKYKELMMAVDVSVSGLTKSTEAHRAISAKLTNLLDWHAIPNNDFALSRGAEYDNNHALKLAKSAIRLLHTLNDTSNQHCRNITMSLYEAGLIGHGETK